ncbi:MAG: hypothetical protein RLZZ227_1833 [Pseudomonadota bacterium]|jgi:dethiobiotin synthetase
MTVALRRSFFVTGTDTDIGKTLACCAVLRAAAAAGHTTVGMKPVAAGGMQAADGLRNNDALQLQAASTLQLSYEEINPVCLPEPASPHIAAELAQRKVRVERLTGFCRGVLGLRANVTLFEGAGGWRVPINEREFMSDLAKELNLPVILVVGMRLGCLNHALLTGEAIVRDGLTIAGWIANRIDPHMEHYERNRDTLRDMFNAPLLAEIPHLGGADPAAHAAAFVRLDRLL